MVIFFVFQELLLLELVLPDVVESHVVEVVAVLAHLPQHGIFFFGKISDDI